jgi:hypothetical protein
MVLQSSQKAEAKDKQRPFLVRRRSKTVNEQKISLEN